VAAGKLDRALEQKLSPEGASRAVAGYDVLHFIGHASRKERDGQSVVLLSEDESGEPQELSGELLVQLLRASRVPRLFFLNACDTADLAGEPSSPGLVPALIAAGAPAVVAMQYPISDATARVFAETFYRELLRNGQADWAAAVARKAVATGEVPALDWGAPVVYLQARHGFVFRRS
jgi:CHAT domain-containing protein